MLRITDVRQRPEKVGFTACPPGPYFVNVRCLLCPRLSTVLAFMAGPLHATSSRLTTASRKSSSDAAPLNLEGGVPKATRDITASPFIHRTTATHDHAQTFWQDQTPKAQASKQKLARIKEIDKDPRAKRQVIEHCSSGIVDTPVQFSRLTPRFVQ
ncbi:hypothetical protein CF336_g1905 [Tilletia laevis]|uniref:Uncharacterized protein n=1 Tax=Tilletia caries TaxID=13290 RepID=A0A177UIA5_9BASI|nr:hypothetical protein CF335_g5867 [Tilletia laevis]KAE8197986.1 hypothetical protein CF336_g1905 [Tilletia laevis]KAE8252222.1 hypothetical protein A4X03_0g6224 [Tilletia caries]